MAKKEINNSTEKIDTKGYIEGTLEDLKMIQNIPLRSIDFESTSADVHDPEMRPLSVSLSVDKGKSYIYFADKKGKFSKEVIKTINDSKAKTIVAARPFEENIIKYKIGQEPKGTFVDVLPMAHILDETKGFRYNLEMVANDYAGMKNIKDMAEGMRGDLINASKETIIKYNGVDSDATLRSYNVMRGLYKQDKKLERYFSFFMQPVQNMFSEISQNGCKIDTEKLKENQEELFKTMGILAEDAFKIIPKEIKEIHFKKGLSLTRDIILRDYLFDSRYGLRLKPISGYITAKKFLPQITEDHLKYFDKIKFVQLYLRWSKIKNLEGYFPKFWNAIQSDSRIYPNTLFTRTVTGRTVMLNPPVQIFPVRGEYAKYLKECFISDDGWLWGERDLAQSELRIIGWLAQDPNILGALSKGIDLHTWTVHIIFGVPLDKITKDQRQKAKAINFGEHIKLDKMLIGLVSLNI